MPLSSAIGCSRLTLHPALSAFSKFRQFMRSAASDKIGSVQTFAAKSTNDRYGRSEKFLR